MHNQEFLPQPSPGETVDGFIEALWIEKNSDGTILVDLPNGKVYDVSEDIICVEDFKRVPVQS